VLERGSGRDWVAICPSALASSPVSWNEFAWIRGIIGTAAFRWKIRRAPIELLESWRSVHPMRGRRTSPQGALRAGVRGRVTLVFMSSATRPKTFVVFSEQASR